MTTQWDGDLVMGIDPSAKKIAWSMHSPTLMVHSVGSAGLYAKGQTKQTPDSIHAAMREMRNLLGSTQKMGLGGVAYVEMPLVGRGGVTTSLKQAYVSGVIQACLIDFGWKVYLVNVSTWRKELGITSRDTKSIKADTKRVVQTYWPKAAVMCGADGDLIDASAVAIYGAEQLRKAAVITDAGLAGSELQGSGRLAVVRSTRVRPSVR